MAVALHRTRATGRLNIHIAEEESGINAHRGDMRHVNRVFTPSDEMRRVMNDGRRRDVHLCGKQTVSRAEATRAEDMALGERPSFSPDDQHQDKKKYADSDGCNDVWRLKIELICHK